MSNGGSLGLTAAILAIGIILIAATAASVILSSSTTSDEQNYEQMTEEALEEISTYIQTKDVMGKYYYDDGAKHIQKIALLIKTMFSVEIDVSGLTIKLCNGEQTNILYYSGKAAFIYSNPLFEHPLWDNMSNSTFSFIVTYDKDNSLVDYGTINDHTDMAYIVIKLPEEFTMQKGDRITVTLFPSTGIERTLTLEAPMPMNSIVSLY